MARLVGYTADELKTREWVFEGLTSKAVRLSVRALAANLHGIITAATAQAAPTLSNSDMQVLTSTWSQHVENELYPYLVQTFVDSAANIHPDLEELTGESVSKVDYDFATHYLRGAANRLVGIGDVLWENMREQLAEGYQLGETTHQLAARIRSVADVSEPRAAMIARTEVVPAANFASLYQVQLAGFTDAECRKGWLATEDSRTRPEHHSADGQLAALSKPFKVGGELLNFPGDWSLGASADNVINCRCSIEFIFDDDITVADASFEALHPRDDHGRFGTKAPFHILPRHLRGKSGDGYYGPGMFGKYGGAGVMMRHVDEHGTARYMVMQRGPNNSKSKWLWQLPGGSIDENETPIQAAAREANEEIGITPDQLATLVPRGAHVVELPVEGKAPWRYSSFVADAPKAFMPKIDPKELGAARWLTYEQLVEMRGRGRLIAPFAAQLDDIISKFDGPSDVDVPEVNVKSSKKPKTNVVADLLQNTPYGTDADLEDIEVPADAVDQITANFSGKFAGLDIGKIEVKWVNHEDKSYGDTPTYHVGLEVTGQIFKDGKRVGNFIRIFYTDEKTGALTVDHAYLNIDSTMQGQGFAREFNNHNIEWYRQEGVKMITLEANISVGGYAWAVAGYQWRGVAEDKIFERFEEVLADKYSTELTRLGDRYDEQVALARDFLEKWRKSSDVNPLDVAKLGRWPGAGKDDWWIGKSILMTIKSSWWGELAI